jgi:DNA-binding transcriptional MerR regulator
MRLKTSYSAREVAALTGLTARQLQRWDTTRVFPPAIAPRRTSSGGFTERRYTPVDVLELLALAELRRAGFAPAVLKQLMDTLRECFRRRLSETLDDAGEMRLLTDGARLFLRTRQGHVFDLLVNPSQPLITGDGLGLVAVAGRAKRRPRPGRRSRRATKAASPR